MTYKMLCCENKTIEDACKGLFEPKLANGHWRVARSIFEATAIVRLEGPPALVIVDKNMAKVCRDYFWLLGATPLILPV